MFNCIMLTKSMLLPRVIPVLLLEGEGLVKTTNFKKPVYVGDPRNAVKIFNEKAVDELILADITATIENREPNFPLIAEIVSEAFIPLCYGGGISNIEQIKKLFYTGVEKISLNTNAVLNFDLIKEAASIFGNQSIVVSIDVKKSFFGKYEVYIQSGRKKTKYHPVELAKRLEDCGAGEILLTSIDKEGTMSGYDLKLIEEVATAVNVPLVALGGAGKMSDFADAIKKGKASAVAAGCKFVFQGKHRAVLINYPTQKELEEYLR